MIIKVKQCQGSMTGFIVGMDIHLLCDTYMRFERLGFLHSYPAPPPPPPFLFLPPLTPKSTENQEECTACCYFSVKQ